MKQILAILASLTLAIFSGTVLAKNGNGNGFDGVHTGNGYGHCKQNGKGHHLDHVQHAGWEHLHDGCGDGEPEPELICSADPVDFEEQWDTFTEGSGDEAISISVLVGLTFTGRICDPAVYDDYTSYSEDLDSDNNGSPDSKCAFSEFDSSGPVYASTSTEYWYDTTITLTCAEFD